MLADGGPAGPAAGERAGGELMAKLKMTYEIAHTIGMDAGNRAMRKAGRAAWNEDDYNESVRAFNKAYPLEVELADKLAAFNEALKHRAEGGR